MKKPADLEFRGRSFHFTEETTNVFGYPLSPTYDHVELEEYGTQKVYFWDAGQLIVYLSGMVISDIEEEYVAEELTDAFYEEYGWNAPVIQKRRVERHIIERYIGSMTKYLIDLPTYEKEEK